MSSSNGRAPHEPATWSDANPYYLVIVTDEDTRTTTIDLGERGWLTTHAALLREPGWWLLCDKRNGGALFTLTVLEGEQPYYTARHIGVAGSGGSNEITAYGIGKKRKDGHVDRLWVVGGTVCAGDDVDILGRRLLEALGPRG